ncbi:MAG TPA: hypothetical protein VFA10_18280 [Ktedonobacteraceae bacterium]|nr:hypothetical protein [Ktedonobacteraceae bacterium]
MDTIGCMIKSGEREAFKVPASPAFAKRSLNASCSLTQVRGLALAVMVWRKSKRSGTPYMLLSPRHFLEAQGESPAVGTAAQGQALDQPTQTAMPLTIEQVKPTNAQQPLIAAIVPIVAIPSSVMDAGGRSVHQPPKGQEEHQEHAIEPIQSAHMALFPVPASTFHSLEGGFHPHAPAIFASRPCAQQVCQK